MSRKAMTALCIINALAACTDLDAPAKDHSIALGTLLSDAVRDSATAIALAEIFCRSEAISKGRHWRATLRGDVWIVDQIIPGAYPDDEINGALIKIRKQDGAAVSKCQEVITVY